MASSTSVGPLPGNWLAAPIADLTTDLQVLLSWGSIKKIKLVVKWHQVCQAVICQPISHWSSPLYILASVLECSIESEKDTYLRKKKLECFMSPSIVNSLLCLSCKSACVLLYWSQQYYHCLLDYKIQYSPFITLIIIKHIGCSMISLGPKNVEFCIEIKGNDRYSAKQFSENDYNMPVPYTFFVRSNSRNILLYLFLCNCPLRTGFL